MTNEKNSKLYTFIFVAMIVTALVLVIVRQFEKTTDVNNEEQKPEEVVVIDEKDGVLGNKDDLVYLNIKPYEEVQGVIFYKGEVKGGYFFEANILINILDANKNTVLKSFSSAKTDWMTSEPVMFEGVLDLSKMNSGLHYLEIHNDNASGLPEHDKSILIPIIIK